MAPMLSTCTHCTIPGRLFSVLTQFVCGVWVPLGAVVCASSDYWCFSPPFSPGVYCEWEECWIGAVPSEGGRNRHCSYMHMHIHETHRTNACRSEEIELKCFTYVRGKQQRLSILYGPNYIPLLSPSCIPLHTLTPVWHGQSHMAHILKTAHHSAMHRVLHCEVHFHWM